MAKLAIFESESVNSKNEPGWGEYNWQFLAQGDSWFSTSTVKGKRSNILENLDFPQAAAVVNCATPGDELTHMVDARRDPLFNSLLCGPKQQFWTALFLSGGGNDLIDAVRVPPTLNGTAVIPHDRLVLTESEWGTDIADPASRYISKDGWAVFQTHLEQQYRIVDSMRAQNQASKAATYVIPIFTHTYDYATPRNSGAGLNIGPWLYPAMTLYQIPTGDWDTLANTFIDKLYAIIKGTEGVLSNFYVIDTRGSLDRAADGAEGISGDWENEIHATADGYAKIGLRFVPKVCAVINMQPVASGTQGFVEMTQPGGPARTDGIDVPADVATSATKTGGAPTGDARP